MGTHDDVEYKDHMERRIKRSELEIRYIVVQDRFLKIRHIEMKGYNKCCAVHDIHESLSLSLSLTLELSLAR